MNRNYSRLTDYTAYQRPQSSTLHILYHDRQIRPCLLILPGGGYQQVAVEKEGLRICDWAQQQQYHAALLTYRVCTLSPERLIHDLEETMAALTVDPLITDTVVVGFSAGAHAAGLLGTSCFLKPKGMILCYPVVTLTGPATHQGSLQHLLGVQAAEETRAAYSLQNRITADTPPCFIWHTAGDCTVPMKNSLLLAESLTRQQISFELHLFPGGRHGLAMTGESAHIQQWVALAESWLKQLLGGTKP